MRKGLFIALAASGLFFSCKSMLLKSYGIKDPALENKSSMNAFLVKKDIDTTNVIMFKDFNAYAITAKNGLKIPDAMFFNTKGNFVNYQKTPQDCNAKVWDFIADIKDIGNLPEDKEVNIFEKSELFTTPDGIAIKVEQGYDAYVLINWAVYAGKLNDEKVFEWISLINEANKEFKVKYYLLNCDFQENWNLTEKQKKDLGIG